MAEVIRLSRMSDTMEEGVLADVLIKVGDKIKSGSVIAEVETDKATMELESYQEGTVLYVAVKKGDSVPVNSILAVIGKEGEDYKHLLEAAPVKAAEAAPVKESTPEVKTAAAVETVSAPASTDGRAKISPLAKKIAAENNVSINALSGSGEDGRIVKKDVEAALQNGVPTSKTPTVQAPLGTESYTDIPLTQMRKVIAKRLSESMYTAPHFYLTIEVNMDNAMAARAQLNELAESKISFNDLVIKSVAKSLQRNPNVNASWLGDKIRVNHHVHIGMAVAIEDGLVVPVIRFADQKSLNAIAAETKSLGEKAKKKQIQPAEMQGNTFTISNLGMLGVEEFTAIINPPDACILAVGSIKQTVGVVQNEMKITNVMKLTLSCDHRAVDGALGAAFLKDVKNFLENPVTMLL